MINKVSIKSIKTLICICLIVIPISCSSKAVAIKSPCVSLEGGPCGPKKSINDWWLKVNT